jgi:MipA family protein
LKLKLATHAVIASDFNSVSHVGWVGNPYLNWDMKDIAGSGWRVGVLAGPYYHSREYNQYLYGVEPRFATTTRAAYNARGGYAGASAIVGVSKRFKDLWVGAFAKYDSLGGATFADSPLVRSRSNNTIGIAVTYVFAKSAARREAED